MCTHNKDNEWYIYLHNKDTMSQSLPQPGGMTQEWWNDPRMVHLPIYNKDTMSQTLPQPGGTAQECALIIRIMNGDTSTC